MIDRGRKNQRANMFLASAGNNRSDQVEYITPERVALDKQQLELLEETITNLPPKQRRVFILRSIHNLSYDEIVAETGLSKAGVKQHIVRALATCRLAREANETGQDVDMRKHDTSKRPLYTTTRAV